MSDKDGFAEDVVEFMQVPSGAVLDICLNKLIKIDGNGIYVLVRERPSVLWKSDVAVLKNVPPEGMTSVTVLREGRGDRLKSAIGGFLVGIGLLAFLVLIFQRGWRLVGDIIIVPVLVAVVGLQVFRVFTDVDTILIFLAEGKRYEVRLRPTRWQREGPRIMRIIDSWGCPIRT